MTARRKQSGSSIFCGVFGIRKPLQRDAIGITEEVEMVDQEVRNEIVHLSLLGHSGRDIAKRLRVSRNTVRSVLRQRAEGGGQHLRLARRSSKLDGYDGQIVEILQRTPGIAVTELLRQLKAIGFTGSYTILRERVQQLRSTAIASQSRSVLAPGVEAICKIISKAVRFRESEKQLNLFVFQLRYSGLTYLRFLHSAGLIDILFHQARAFESMNGVPTVIAHSSVNALFAFGDTNTSCYNAAFLRFASHYGFKPLHVPELTIDMDRSLVTASELLDDCPAPESIEQINYWLSRKPFINDESLSEPRRTQKDLQSLIRLPKTCFDI